jgi:hypothetical protein
MNENLKALNERIKLRGNALEKFRQEAVKRLQDMAKDIALSGPFLFEEIKTDQSGMMLNKPVNFILANVIAGKLTRSLIEKFRVFARWVIQTTKKIFANLRSFTRFSTGSPVPQTVQEYAAKMVMRKLGFDVVENRLIKNGWLWGLTEKHTISQDIAQRLTTSILRGSTLNNWLKEFTELFVNQAGYLQRHFQTFTRDFWSMTDAATNLYYKEQLDLKYAIWSGTVMAETRPFCERNNNQVFTEKELIEMGKQDWKGKKEQNDIFLDRGGYNCRHILSWISEDLAISLRPDLETKKAS